MSLCREDVPLLPDVSKEPTAFIFKVTNQSRSHNRKFEGGSFLRNVGKQLNSRRDDLLSRYADRFATNKIFQRCVIAVGKAATLPLHQPHLSLLYSFSFPCFTKTGRLAVIIVALLTFKWTTCRKLHTAFSLSLSRTHTRTHARTLQAAKLAANTLLP